MKKRIWSSLRFPIFFSSVIALLECILYHASFLAIFRGFGGVPLEYTENGGIAMGILVLIPLLLLIAVLFVRLVKLYRSKANKRWYVVEIIGFVLGFGVGILIVILAYEFSTPFLKDFLYEAARLLAIIIEIAGLVKYPAP